MKSRKSLIALLGAALLCVAATTKTHAATGHAIVCPGPASVVGKQASGSAASCAGQTYRTPAATSIVRAHPTGGNVAAADPLKVWRVLSTIPAGQFYEIALTDVPENTTVNTNLVSAWGWKQVGGPVVPPVLELGTALVSWVPPTQNTNNSPLTDLAGFRLYQGPVSPPTQQMQQLGASVTSFQVTGLAPGTWYFGVKAYNAADVESPLSNIGSKVIAAPSPACTVTLSASPSDAVESVTARLNWSSTNATSLTATGDWSGAKTVGSGTELMPAANVSKRYTLACSGPGGNAITSVDVSVSTRPKAATVTVQ